MADYDQRISQLEASISQLQNFIRSSRNTDTSSTKRLHHKSRRTNGTGEPVSQQDPWDAVESMLAKISKEVEAIKFDIANTQGKSDGLIALETATHSEPCSDLHSNPRGQGEAIRHEDDPFNGLPLRHPDPTVVDSGNEAILETGSDHWSTLSSPLTPLSDVELTNEHFTLNANQLGEESTKSIQLRTPLPTSPGRKSSTAQSKQISANRNSLAVVIQSPQFIATPDSDGTITEDSLAPGEMVTVEPSKDNTNNHSAQPVATPAQDGREASAAIFQLPLAGNNDDGTLSLDVDAALESADMAMAPVPLPITPVSSRQEDTAMAGCQVGTPKSVQSPTTLGAQGDTALVEHQVTSSQSQPHSAGNESVSLPVTLDGNAARTQVAAQGIDDISRVRTTTDTSALLLSPELPPSLSHAALSPADMGEKLTLKLAEMDANNMSQKFFVPPVDIDLGQIQASINAGNDSWQFTSIRYKPTPKEGCTNVYISDAKSDLDWSAFTQEIKRPTVEQARRIFEDAVQHPPKGDIDYYVGHANIPLMRPLNPGPRILQDQGLKDLHTAYHHIGTNLSANRMHQEDMTCRDPASISPKYYGFRSYNEVYFGTGYKLWLVIAEYHIAKFDDFFKDNWACGECSQGLGHESLLFSPSRLEKEGIDYEIYVIGRQEAFRTKPGQQHQIINYGFNVARSINYAHLDDKLMPENCAFCPYCHMKPALEQRGAKRVTLPRPLNESPSLVGKRKADGQDLGTTRKTRAYTTAKQKWNQLEGKVKKADPYCHFPVILNPSEFQSDVLRKAVSVRSSLAVKQFMGLVHEWRRRGTHIVISDDAGDLCLQHGRRLKAAAEHSSLSKFELRYAQACVARHVDRQMNERGQIRRNKEITDRLAKDLDMDSKELKYHLEDGRLWNSVCGPKCEGLLPFFLLDSYKPLDPDQLLYICKKEWRALKDEHLGAFHSLLQDDYIENLCRAGVAFQEILSKGAKHIFSWEKEGLDITAKDWASFLWKMESSPHAD